MTKDVRRHEREVAKQVSFRQRRLLQRRIGGPVHPIEMGHLELVSADGDHVGVLRLFELRDDFAFAAESVLPGYRGEPRTMRTGDITVLATSEYDVAGSRMFSRYRFTRGEEELDVTAIHHVYTVAQLVDLLSGNGFTEFDLFAGPGGEPYGIGCGRLLPTARRTS